MADTTKAVAVRESSEVAAPAPRRESQVARAVEALNDWAYEVELSTDIADLVVNLRDLKQLRRAIGMIESRFTELITESAPGRVFELDGVGYVQIRRASTRSKWDHDALVREVVKRAIGDRAPDPTTGEIEPPEEAAVRAIKECAGFSYWRVGALKARGIDPDEFCEKTPGQFQVSVGGE